MLLRPWLCGTVWESQGLHKTGAMILDAGASRPYMSYCQYFNIWLAKVPFRVDIAVLPVV